jgi:hypothetical protein
LRVSAIARIPERDQLERLDNAIEQWIQLVREQAETIDSEAADRLISTGRRFAMRIDDNITPNLDPASVAEFRGILLGGLRKLEDIEEGRQLDVLDDFLVRAESIRHIIRDALDEDLGCDPGDVQCFTRLIVEALPRIPQTDIAQLLRVDRKTVQRWLHGQGRASRRLYLVARLVNVLQHAWTPEGVIAWFGRPRQDLDGHDPLDVLDDPAYEQALIAAARRGRAEHGA